MTFDFLPDWLQFSWNPSNLWPQKVNVRAKFGFTLNCLLSWWLSVVEMCFPSVCALLMCVFISVNTEINRRRLYVTWTMQADNGNTDRRTHTDTHVGLIIVPVSIPFINLMQTVIFKPNLNPWTTGPTKISSQIQKCPTMVLSLNLSTHSWRDTHILTHTCLLALGKTFAKSLTSF